MTFYQYPNINGVPAVARITLTPSQILNLDNVEVVVIPAPGPNNLLIPTVVLARLNFKTTPYASQTGLFYSIGSTQAQGSTFSTTLHSILAQTSTTLGATDFTTGAMDSQLVSPTSKAINQGFQVGTGGNGNPTGGDSTVDLWVYYHVVPIV